MNGQAIAFFLFGASLVVTLVAIIIFYYSRKRRARIEEPKYKIFDDED